MSEHSAVGSIFDRLIETEAEERARLALSPAGSTTHGLSQLPERLTGGYVEGVAIELPRLPLADGTVPSAEEHTVIVVPTRFHVDPEQRAEKPRRNSGWWTCVVVHSTDVAYPVGGHQLCISTAELVRGTPARIVPAAASAADVDDLILEAREWPRDGVNEGRLINGLADEVERLRTESRTITDAMVFAADGVMLGFSSGTQYEMIRKMLEAAEAAR